MNEGIRIWNWHDAPQPLREAFAVACYGDKECAGVGRACQFTHGDLAFLLVALVDDVEAMKQIGEHPKPNPDCWYTVYEHFDKGTGRNATFEWEGVQVHAVLWIDT